MGQTTADLALSVDRQLGRARIGRICGSSIGSSVATSNTVAPVRNSLSTRVSRLPCRAKLTWRQPPKLAPRRPYIADFTPFWPLTFVLRTRSRNSLPQLTHRRSGGLPSLNRGLLYRHAYPLTTWGAVFVYYWQPRDDDFRTGTLPFVERAGSHRLRWPYRLVSEFAPPRPPAPRRAFFVVVAGFGKAGFGLSQRSCPSGRRPSEAGHFCTCAGRL